MSIAAHVDLPMLGLILFVSSLTAMLTRRIGMPYSVGLVIAGFAMAVSPLGTGFHLTPEIIMQVFLPPLVFEAAVHIEWRSFRREFPLLFALVTIGVLLAAAIVAAAMHWLVGWGWLAAAFFGVLIAATDPVAVIATFREIKVDSRLHLLVEAESLLNDGVAALGFALLLGIAAGAGVGPIEIGVSLMRIAIGGTLCGVAIGWMCLLIAGRTEDPLVEISLTMIAAYGSFLLADHFHMSGVLATLAAGIVVGNFGKRGALSKAGRPLLLNVWEFAAFLANSFVFILIGDAGAKPALLAAIPVAAVATLAALAGRAVAVYPISFAFARSRLAVPMGYQHILFWGGLRGALALALALALPPDLPERTAVISAAFLVVAFSIFVQGLTMPRLIARLGLIRDDDPDCGQPGMPDCL
ncbi:MAG: cation:proton antiporter [Sphingomicrobium sp.]